MLRKIKLDAVDFINKHKISISILISIIFSICYVYFHFIRSIRSCVSDIISISSIILGIMGVFVGLLISLRDSNFVKTLNTYMDTEGQDAFQYLLNYVKTQFIIGLCFVFATVMIDFVPSIKSGLIKGILIAIWLVLLLLTLWGIFYIVDIIIKIELKDYASNKNKVKNEKNDTECKCNKNNN